MSKIMCSYIFTDAQGVLTTDYIIIDDNLVENLEIFGIRYGACYIHIDKCDWKSFFDETNSAVNINSWYDYFEIAGSVKPEPIVNNNTYTIWWK